MEICCSFKSIVGGICGFDRKDRGHDTQVIPLMTCKKDISSHLRSCKFTGSRNEVDLILSRAGLFKAPKNIQEITICPNHRSVLGVGWSRSSNTRCRVPQEVSGHKGKGKMPKADKGVEKGSSQMLLKHTGIFIHIGSGKSGKSNFYLITSTGQIFEFTFPFNNVYKLLKKVKTNGA